MKKQPPGFKSQEWQEMASDSSKEQVVLHKFRDLILSAHLGRADLDIQLKKSNHILKRLLYKANTNWLIYRDKLSFGFF